MAVKKPTKKAAKKAARKPTSASQRAFRMFADDCTDHLALHTGQLKELGARCNERWRKLNAAIDANEQGLQQTIRAVCRSEIMAHMQRLLGAERWKEMMAAPAVVVNATAETILTPLKPEPLSGAELLRQAAGRLGSLQSTVTVEYGEDEGAHFTRELQRHLLDEALRIEKAEAAK